MFYKAVNTCVHAVLPFLLLSLKRKEIGTWLVIQVGSERSVEVDEFKNLTSHSTNSSFMENHKMISCTAYQKFGFYPTAVFPWQLNWWECVLQQETLYTVPQPTFVSKQQSVSRTGHRNPWASWSKWHVMLKQMHIRHAISFHWNKCLFLIWCCYLIELWLRIQSWWLRISLLLSLRLLWSAQV